MRARARPLNLLQCRNALERLGHRGSVLTNRCVRRTVTGRHRRKPANRARAARLSGVAAQSPLEAAPRPPLLQRDGEEGACARRWFWNSWRRPRALRGGRRAKRTAQNCQNGAAAAAADQRTRSPEQAEVHAAGGSSRGCWPRRRVERETADRRQAAANLSRVTLIAWPDETSLRPGLRSPAPESSPEMYRASPRRRSTRKPERCSHQPSSTNPGLASPEPSSCRAEVATTSDAAVPGQPVAWTAASP